MGVLILVIYMLSPRHFWDHNTVARSHNIKSIARVLNFTPNKSLALNTHSLVFACDKSFFCKKQKLNAYAEGSGKLITAW